MKAALLNVAQACERLTVSRATLYRLMAAGKLTGAKIGGCRRFQPADLNNFIRKHRQVTKAGK